MEGKKKKKNKKSRQNILRIQIPKTTKFIAIKFRTQNFVIAILKLSIQQTDSALHISPFKQYSSIWHLTFSQSNTTKTSNLFVFFFLLVIFVNGYMSHIFRLEHRSIQRKYEQQHRVSTTFKARSSQSFDKLHNQIINY